MTEESNVADFAAAHRAKPRFREIVVAHRDGGRSSYSLVWPSHKYLGEIDGNLVVTQLVEAGLSLNGKPIGREVLERLPWRSMALIVRLIDRHLANEAIPEHTGIQVSAQSEEFLQVDLFVGGQWRTFTMLPWGTALREAIDDPVRLREVFRAIRLSIDGGELTMESLCEASDATILSIAFALRQAAAESVAI